jgi:hypothetical protein
MGLRRKLLVTLRQLRVVAIFFPVKGQKGHQKGQFSLFKLVEMRILLAGCAVP